MSTNYQNILTEVREKVGIITINRPKALNAMNIDTLNELISAVKIFDDDKSVRVIIITGAGDKAFVAGADITGFPKMGKSGADQFAHIGHDLMRTVESSVKPVIAAVNGYALGGGTELALACDFIYASENAVFGLPETSLGIFPGFGGTQRLNKVVGMNRAREIIYTGKKIKVLFLCTGNSCRSQMAEGWARHLWPEKIAAYSAGTRPHGLDPLAVEVMKEAGVDISGQESTRVTEAMLAAADHVVTVCGHADEQCPVLPPGIRKEHWPLSDPAKAAGTEEEILSVFRQTRDEIRQRVEELINRLKHNQLKLNGK